MRLIRPRIVYLAHVVLIIEKPAIATSLILVQGVPLSSIARLLRVVRVMTEPPFRLVVPKVVLHGLCSLAVLDLALLTLVLLLDHAEE